MVTAVCVCMDLHYTRIQGSRHPLQKLGMMAFNDGDVVGHSSMAKFLKPFAWVAVHARQGVGHHQMAAGFDGFAFAGGEKILSVATPETINRDGHADANGGFETSGLFNVEMAGNARTAGFTDRFAERYRRSAAV